MCRSICVKYDTAPLSPTIDQIPVIYSKTEVSSCRDFVSYTLRVFLFVILGENAASEMSFKPEFIRIAPPLYQCEDEVLLLA